MDEGCNRGLEGLMKFQRNLLKEANVSENEISTIIEGDFSENARKTYCLNFCKYRTECHIAKEKGFVNHEGYESNLLGIRIVPDRNASEGYLLFH